jgi:hypothetical protein
MFCDAVQLILPSGLLQEAGSLVWSDASALGYGRGWVADIGEVMFRRAGFRVLYESAVVVDHYEFGSEVNPAEANAVSLVNRKRFRARHAKGLHVAHLPFAPTNVLAARERYAQGRRSTSQPGCPTKSREAGHQRLLREHSAEDFRKRLYAVLDGRLSD